MPTGFFFPGCKASSKTVALLGHYVCQSLSLCIFYSLNYHLSWVSILICTAVFIPANPAQGVDLLDHIPVLVILVGSIQPTTLMPFGFFNQVAHGIVLIMNLHRDVYTLYWVIVEFGHPGYEVIYLS